MFNRKKLNKLKWQIGILEGDRYCHQKQIRELRGDVERLARYLGVQFVNVNERRVQEVTPKPEEV